MEIELRPIDSIRPYESNPRNNDSAVDVVADSIRRFGFRQPVVVDLDSIIIVGHTRYKAAVKLGLERVPVHVADLSPEAAKAYRLIDNQSATLSSWDEALLSAELHGLEGLNFDVTTLGFDDEELQRLLSGDVAAGETDPDAVPAPPDKAVTQPGDLWLLGDHRLLCGDSASGADVDKLLDGAAVYLVNTDPPYNVKVEPRSNNAFVAGETSFHPVSQPGDNGRNKKKSKPPAVKRTTEKLRAKDRALENDNVSDEQFARLLDAWFGNIARVLVPGGAFYVWGGYANCGNYPPVLERHGLYFSQAIIWVKEHPVLTRKDYMGNHEWSFYGWREGAGHKFYGPNNVPDVWSIKKVSPQAMVHLTEKPVELAVRAMQYSSLAGQNVLDLFGGSGSTMIAAEQTGRRSYLMEIDPLYADVIVQRWEGFTGKKAKRLPAGGTGHKKRTPAERAGVASEAGVR
jgi:DNA modification methylase